MLFLSSQGIPKEITTYFSEPQGSNSGAIISSCVCVPHAADAGHVLAGCRCFGLGLKLGIKGHAAMGKIPWYAYIGGQAVFSSTGLGLR